MKVNGVCTSVHPPAYKCHATVKAFHSWWLLWLCTLCIQVELLADGNGGFVRMMGFELGIAEGSGPKCQRFAGIVDDGVLLKVVSEVVGLSTSPGTVRISSSAFARSSAGPYHSSLWLCSYLVDARAAF